MRGLVAVLSVICLLLSASAATAGNRVALVIGNGTYKNASRLTTPAGDARDMADHLRTVGFEVIAGIDLTREDFNRRLLEFAGKASGADVALFFYAGYAIAVNRRNYLVPVEADPESEKDVLAQAIDAEHAVLGAMAGARSKLLVLDATPGNPFPSKLKAAVSPGLAPMTPGERTLIAFATDPGAASVAGDGPKNVDGHSVFTRALLMNMRTSGVSMQEAVKRSRVQVARESGGVQIPWLRETLPDRDFSLAGESSTIIRADASPTKIVPAPEPPPGFNLAQAPPPTPDEKLISREGAPAGAGGAAPPALNNAQRAPATSYVTPHVVKTIRIGPDETIATQTPADSPALTQMATEDSAPSPAPSPQKPGEQQQAAASPPTTQADPNAEARAREEAARSKAIAKENGDRIIAGLQPRPPTRALTEDGIVAALKPKPLTRALSIGPSDLTPTEREEIADISKQKPVLDTGGLPDFPWPPPKASASYVLPDQLLKNNNTMAEAVQAILSALERTGYVERSFFKTRPGGVALVTQLERIQPDGTPFVESDRWALDQSNYRTTADLIKFLRGLFFVDPGHYRLIVFILQDTPFVQSNTKLDGSEARQMIAKGANVLPAETGKRSFAGSHCTVLVYEFASDGKAVHMVESHLTGKQHLDKAGVLSSLGKAN
jgi:uncharacterized caspase-like protein